MNKFIFGRIFDRASSCVSDLMLRAKCFGEIQQLPQKLPLIDAFELEPRVLYSASPLPVDLLVDAFADTPSDADAGFTDFANNADNNGWDQQGGSLFPLFESESIFGDVPTLPSFDNLIEESTASELILINEGIEDVEQIIADLAVNNPDAEVVFLQSNRDGMTQISELLAKRSGIEAIHIVSHGTDGSVQLGNSWLTNETLQSHAGEIAGWGISLTADADILFYGCNLAASQNGQELIESLSELTDADIAASDDLTGHESLGGDWDLEYASGQIETEIAFSIDVQQQWEHVLAPPAITMPGTPVDYLIGDPATVIDPAATVSDPDSPDFDGGTLTVSITSGGSANDRLSIDQSGDFTLSGADIRYQPGGPPKIIGTWSGGTDGSTPLILSLNADANPANVQELLRSITFQNVSGTPTQDDRLVEFVLNDGTSGNSNVETETVRINDPIPNVDLDADDSQGTSGVDFTTTYVFGAGNVRITDSDAVINDDDSTQLGRLDAQLTTGYINGQDKLVHDETLASSYGISFSWNAAQGRLRLTGTATIAQYEEVLRTIEFTDLSGNPDPTNNRIVEVTVRDIDNNSSTTVARSEIFFQKTSELWFTTGGDVTGGQGVTELPNWENEDILSLSNPTFEPGTSGGTMAVAFDTNTVGGYSGNINATHFVSRDIMVNGVQLEYGDILLSGKNPGFVGSIYATKGDLFYYDASVGDFAHLVVNMTGTSDLTAVTLVEQRTYVGDTWLEAGTLLYGVGSSGAFKDDIMIWDSGAGSGSTFIDGDSPTVSIDGGIAGLDLVETNINLNGHLFTSGQILVTLDGDGSYFGEDIFVLDATGTEATGVGNSAATHSLLFEGKDKGLDVPVIFGDPEFINGITLVSSEGAAVLSDPPVLGANQLTVSEGDTVVLDGTNFGASDVDSPDPSLIFDVSSVLGGHFALATDTVTPIFSFTQAQITAADIVFVDNGDETAPSYNVSVTDGSNPTAPVAATINYTPVNDVPVLGANQLTLSEGDTVVLDGTNFSASDVESSDPSLTFNVSSVLGGHFALATDTATPIFSFMQAQITAADIVFVDGGDETAPSYSVSVTDGTDPTTPVAATINYTPVNDVPVLGANQLTLTEGDTVVLDGTNFSASDVETADPSLIFNVSSVLGGHFALATDTVTPIFSFTQAQITAADIVFVDNGDETAPSYNVSVTDGTDPTTPVAATINFTNVNDAAVLGSNQLTLTAGDTVVLDGTNFSASDIDNPDPGLTFNVSSVLGGHFALATDTVTPIFSFTQAQITAADIVFVDNGDNTPPSYDVSVTDGTDPTTPFAATINFTPGIDVVNGDTSIWFSTIGNATDDNSFSWSDNEAIQVGNPGLQLEPDFATSDGTVISTGFVAPVDMRGMHLVHATSINVGDATLLQGDILFAVDVAHDFGPFTADRHDIVLFRPDAVNDYSSGTYTMFLDEGVHDSGSAYNLHGLSLIEKDVTIGGQSLTAGTLVVAHSTPSDHDNLYTVQVNTTGIGAATNTDDKVIFLDGSSGGSNLNFGDIQIQGIEVLEEQIVMGGTAVAQGSILLTLNVDGNSTQSVGGNSVIVNGEDIFYLTVTSTEQTGGTVGNATLLFEGGDIGLDSGGAKDENLNGLSLINSLDFIGELTVDTATDIYDGDTDSISALLADKGADGLISLREAIEATNNTTNGIAPDRILFDIADDSAGQYYYTDDFSAGTLGAVTAVPVGGEAAIFDFDPDHPYSWFRIDLDDALPQLTVTDAVSIDGYSQWGASQNTQNIGSDAVLRIEVTNRDPAETNRGLTFDTGADGSSLQGLVINDFYWSGIMVDYWVNDVTIQGNYIGTDVSGTLDQGNSDAGIQIRGDDNTIGGPNAADRNVISGSNSRGIAFYSSGTITGNRVENNYIGVDATGLVGLGNDDYGIQLWDADGTQIIDNVISGSEFQGILFRSGGDADNNVIQGNMIGVGADGTTLIGNGAEGIRIESNNATGNLIGGTGVGEGNIIADNGSHGIRLTGLGVASNIVVGNFIGTNAAGVLDLGNAGSGVRISNGSKSNTIGGVGAGEANTIAFNDFDGVTVTGNGSDFNTIRGNVFKENDELAIDLVVASGGVNTNDAFDGDNGANQLQNHPVLSTATVLSGDLTITGTFNSTPGTNGFIIDFYWNAAGSGDASLHGEAENYLGSITVNTDGSGNATINTTIFSAGVPVGAIITATATDPSGNTSEFAMNVSVSGANTAPTDIAPNSMSVNENINTTGGYSVGTLTATDPDSGESFTYSILPGADGGLFSIGGGSLDELILDDGVLDYETKSSYTVNVRVTDSASNTYDETLTVNVNDVNETPTNIAPNSFAINENVDTSSGTSVGTLTASDPDSGETFTYSIVGGADQAKFTIGGALSDELILTDGTLDFETKPSYSVTVRVTDAGGLMYDETLTVNVNDLNETPTDIAPNSFAINENVDTSSGTSVGTLTATDPDSGETFTYSIVGGADQAKFTIGGALSDELILTDGTLDFETKPSYSVTVRVTDAGGLTYDDTLTVNVNDLNDSPTDIAPNSFAINENVDTSSGTSVGTLTASDSDSGETFNYSIVGGVDQAKFTIGGTLNNELILTDGTLDFETKPSYSVTVRVTDAGGLTYDETLTVNVNDLNETPTDIAPNSFAINENVDTSSGTSVGTLTASDPDSGETFTYSIVGGADQAKFTIGGALSDELILTDGTLDFETKPAYNVTVRVTDSFGNTYDEALVVNVNNLNETPTDISPNSLAAPHGSNTTGGLSLGVLSTTDEDVSDTFTYTILPVGDFANFSIGGTGSDELVIDDGVLDSGVKSLYSVTVRVTDSFGNTYDEALAVNVTNVAPTDISPDNFGVNENTNTTGGISLGTLNATDANPSETFTWSILPGADGALFSIGGASTDELIFDDGLLDFESKSSYSVNVRVTDAGGNTYDETLSVDVNDLNETPTDIAPNSFSLDENIDTSSGHSVGTLNATDEDSGETFTYSIVGGVDQAKFTIGGTLNDELILTDGTLDFETKPSYSVTVRVTDAGGLTYDETLTVNVNDLNETPTAIAPVSIHADENIDTTGGYSLGTLSTTDEDSPESFTYSIIGGADAALFGIGGVGSDELIIDDGVLDFETKSAYTVIVRVTDSGSNTYDETITLNVNDRNDAPTSIAPAGISVNEFTNTTGGHSLGTLSATDQDAVDSFTYAIVGGADAALFSIGGSGSDELMIDDGVLDFETKSIYSVTVRVMDSGGSTHDEAITVSVNDLNDVPVTTGIANQTVDEDAADLLLNLHTAFADAEDADSDLIYSIQSVTTPGLFDSVTIDGSDNIVLDFADNQHGSTMITVRATDTGGLSVDTTFQVDVNPVNDDPFVDSSLAPIVVDEDWSNTTINLSSVFDDVDLATSGDWLTYSLVSNSDPTLATAAISGATLTVDYQDDQFGTSTIVVRATDSFGRSVDETIDLTVNSINDAPEVIDHDFTADPESPVAGNVLNGSFDVEGDVLTVSLISGPSSGTLTLNNDGTFVFVPDSDVTGNVSFTFVATDGADNSNIGTTTIEGLVAVILDPVDPPEPEEDPEETEIEIKPVPSGDEEKVSDLPVEKPSVVSSFKPKSEVATIDEQIDKQIESYAKTWNASYFHRTTAEMTQTLSSIEFAMSAPDEHIKMMLSSLASFSEDIEEATANIDYAFVNAVVAMSGVSIGVVTWVLRSGVFLASMMANLPAWRIIDPTVVLGYDSDGEEDGESLQDIVDGETSEGETDVDTNDEEMTDEPIDAQESGQESTELEAASV